MRKTPAVMMWHYIENGRQAGPVDDATFHAMLSDGRITPETHVWREGMPNWALYRHVAASGDTAAMPGALQCAECGNFFSADDLVRIGDRAVCATCKPIAVQKLKEGVIHPVETHSRYAGFWIRFAAWLVDFLIMSVVLRILNFVLIAMEQATNRYGLAFTAIGVDLIIRGAYEIFLVGYCGSTLGMMACGIRVTRPGGEKVTYLRATGRFLARILNIFTLGVGYIMIAFDEEKQALHDRICDTRVVYKR